MDCILEQVVEAQNTAYNACGFKVVDLIPEVESGEYYAHHYKLQNKHIRFRIAKVTPTKVGQFVTLWKRENGGPIQPYDQLDQVDYFVINVLINNKIG